MTNNQEDAADARDEDAANQAEETRALLRTLTAYALYRPSMHAVIQQKRADYISLSTKHKKLLPDLLSKFERADYAIKKNAELAEDILKAASASMLGAAWDAAYKVDDVSDADIDKVRSTLKQLYRDWSVEGRTERELCYGPILEYLDVCFASIPQRDRSQLHVLTPGCGLGRLTYEIAQRGYSSTGNEFSYPMLACSNFIINHTRALSAYQLTADPHIFSNRETRDRTFAPYRVPDVVPRDTIDHPHVGEFSMAMGDFVESFSGAAHVKSFDAVVTCFFLDTAHNILDYLETIRSILKPEGYLINLGPLLWHHENTTLQRRKADTGVGRSSTDKQGQFVGSIELDFEELMHVLDAVGFYVLFTSRHKTPYLGNPHSLLSHEYEAIGFVARLPSA
jgi:carnosine N-methyltransferase